MAETFGLRETYPGFEERKKTAKPEFILIGTPPGSHFEICLQALKAGVHDFCEKPFMPTHRVRPVGSRSYIGCFSTYFAHIITTGTGGTPFTRGLMTTRGARRIGAWIFFPQPVYQQMLGDTEPAGVLHWMSRGND